MESNALQEMITQHLKAYQAKKQAFVNSVIVEKNYGHLIPTTTAMFPKICCIERMGWQLYFADNGNDVGAFIVGIKDKEKQLGYEIENGWDLKLEFEFTKSLPNDWNW